MAVKKLGRAVFFSEGWRVAGDLKYTKLHLTFGTPSKDLPSAAEYLQLRERWFSSLRPTTPKDRRISPYGRAVLNQFEAETDVS